MSSEPPAFPDPGRDFTVRLDVPHETPDALSCLEGNVQEIVRAITKLNGWRLDDRDAAGRRLDAAFERIAALEAIYRSLEACVGRLAANLPDPPEATRPPAETIRWALTQMPAHHGIALLAGLLDAALTQWQDRHGMAAMPYRLTQSLLRELRASMSPGEGHPGA